MYSVDIDIGGTFTDGFFTDGQSFRSAKVLTTQHDVTEGFLACLGHGAQAFDLPLLQYLRRTSVIRLSTTIGTNLLVQAAGARIGLLVTAGEERSVYGDAPDADAALHRIVAPDMILGIAERVEAHGAVSRAPDPDSVLDAVRTLLERGARAIVVSLGNAWSSAANETSVRAIIRARYPAQYLRSVPIHLASEVSREPDDRARTNAALLNAYLHADMAHALYTIEDRLRQQGYEQPLLIVHANGGNARIAKTMALSTLHSGPAVSVHGAARLREVLGLDAVVTADVGGTSLDVALLDAETLLLEERPCIHGLPSAIPAIRIDSYGIGGCSIASAEDQAVVVGPRSAGSAPGPACYGKGGAEPTVTDANLVLGLIDPTYFLGGRMRLDVDAASRALVRRIGRPLGLDARVAAAHVRSAANTRLALSIRESLRFAPETDTASLSLFFTGGGGALHACDVADLLGIRRIHAFPFGSVFGAFGGSTTDIRHVYRRHFATPADAASLAGVLEELLVASVRDVRTEGVADAEAWLAVALQAGPLKDEIRLPVRDASVAAILDRLSTGGALSSGNARLLQLAVSVQTPHWLPEACGLQVREARASGEREVSWRGGDPVSTQVYARGHLLPGHRLSGPALVDGADTVYAVSPGWQAQVDGHGFFQLTRTPEAGHGTSA